MSKMKYFWTRIFDWHFVKDSAVVGIGSTIARTFGLLFWMLLARFLTPDNVGFIRYSTTIASIIAIIATGSTVSVARFLAMKQGDRLTRDRYFSNGLLGCMILLTVSLLLSVPILWLLHAFDPGTILCILGLSAFSFYFAMARGMDNAWKMGLAYFLSNVVEIGALIVVLGIFRLHTITIALAIYGLSYLTPIIMEFFKPMALHFRLNLISTGTLLELARFAVPLVIASAIYTVWNGTDMLLIENLNPQVAGSYAAAKTLGGAFIFIPSAITVILMPRVAHLNVEKSKHYAIGATFAAFLICMIGVIVVILWGHELITLTFGQRYSNAYIPLVVISAGMSFYSIYVVLEGFIIGRGWPSLAVKALAVSLASTGITGFWMTPRFGMLGTSLSFTIGATLGTAVMFFQTWSLLHKEAQMISDELSSTNRVARIPNTGLGVESRRLLEGEQS